MATRPKRITDHKAKVQAYFAALPAPARRRLKELQRAIRAAAPKATPAFSYQIPAYRLGRRILVWYAAFAKHCSLFPMTSAIRRRFARQLAGYRTAKGTVQFPLDRPIPIPLVKQLVRARARVLGAGRSARHAA